jgi:hypothetical protein
MDPGINPAERFADEEEAAHRETMLSAEAPVPHWLSDLCGNAAHYM